MAMDLDTLQQVLTLSHQDPQAQARVFHYYEYLTQSCNGWQDCAHVLISDNLKNEHVEFFCFRIIEHYLKNRYEEADAFQQQQIRQFINHWIIKQVNRKYEEKLSVRNKAAQIICLAFLVDYPHRWPSFFVDLLQWVSIGPGAIDAYLRILLAINGEIADKEIVHTPKELARNTIIKDAIRDNSVGDLVNSWLAIVRSYSNLSPEVVCLCLEVIGGYVAWIDIALIATAEFAQLLIGFLLVPTLREAAADCLRAVLAKGMAPEAKTKLVEAFIRTLSEAGVFHSIQNEEDSEYAVKLSRLLNVMGTSLLESYSKLVSDVMPFMMVTKSDNTNLLPVIRNCINDKIPFMLNFLNSDNEDVSLAITEFAREYIVFLKQEAAWGRYSPKEKEHVEALLKVVFSRYKYDDFYNFDYPGEDEAIFDDYRKTMKVLFDNMAHLDRELVLNQTSHFITEILSKWQALPFQDVEVALSFLYLLGETLPAVHSSSDNKIAPIAHLIRLVVTSGVINHGHIAISKEFFEIMLRYEKFFNQEPQLLPQVLSAFMDERGLNHSSPKIRSRVAYLLSRFIRSQRSQIQDYIEDILVKIQEMLKQNFSTDSYLSYNDQLYLYESAAQLIISSTNLDAQVKHLKLDFLLRPVIAEFELSLQKLQMEPDEQKRIQIAELMNHIIEITCKTSKAFSNQQSMKSCKCVQVYLDALVVFLTSLQVRSNAGSILQTGVRKYLHRLVVCLEEEVVPYIPQAADCLLASMDIQALQEFIPLLNQLIAKFRKGVVPFLQKMFSPFVSAIFSALQIPLEENDQQAQRERQFLQRNYYTFILSIVSNNVMEIIRDKEEMNQILLSIIQGAVEIPDPVAQKTCFSILKCLVEAWGGSDGVPGFVDVIYKSIVPACFMAPLKTTFDLADAQTIRALSESAICIRAIYEKRGDELLIFLNSQYFPTLHLPPVLTTEYCNCLSTNPKQFKTYVKDFFQQIRKL